MPAYLVAALLFIIMNYSLTKIAALVQRRLRGRGQPTGQGKGAVGGQPDPQSDMAGDVQYVDATNAGPGAGL